jgi:hypothetical protein
MVILVPPQLVEFGQVEPGTGQLQSIGRLDGGVWSLAIRQSRCCGHQLERRTWRIDLAGSAVGQRCCGSEASRSYALPAASMSWLAMSFGS